MKAVHYGYLLTPTRDGRMSAFVDGALGINDAGRIVYAGPRRDLGPIPSGVVVYNHGRKVLCPGFVDLHVHLPQIRARARVRGDLLDWLNSEIYPA